MKSPDTHEEMALMLLTKWEFEDELRAIEELLAEARHENVRHKRDVIQHENEFPEDEPKKKSGH
ncbi:MAG TPA: hypothetical protein VJB59_11740 [Bdellovibrionota bacterium]|nr:hypothetical protein [Bdellovibrionota bacterium]